MPFKIRYLPKANNDIIEIEKYLSQFPQSVPKNFFNELDKRISSLQEMPYIGEQYKRYRRLIVGDYLVFYVVNLELNTVDIYCVLHGKRNVRECL